MKHFAITQQSFFNSDQRETPVDGEDVTWTLNCCIQL